MATALPMSTQNFMELIDQERARYERKSLSPKARPRRSKTRGRETISRVDVDGGFDDDVGCMADAEQSPRKHSGRTSRRPSKHNPTPSGSASKQKVRSSASSGRHARATPSTSSGIGRQHSHSKPAPRPPSASAHSKSRTVSSAANDSSGIGRQHSHSQPAPKPPSRSAAVKSKKLRPRPPKHPPPPKARTATPSSKPPAPSKPKTPSSSKPKAPSLSKARKASSKAKTPSKPKTPQTQHRQQQHRQQQRQRHHSATATRTPAPRTLEEHLQIMGLVQYLPLFHWAGASTPQHLALLDAQELAMLGVSMGDIQLLMSYQQDAGLPVGASASATTPTRSRSSRHNNNNHNNNNNESGGSRISGNLAASLSGQDLRSLLKAVNMSSVGDAAPPDGRPPTAAALAKVIPGISTKPWNCHACTFLNEVPGTVFCGACNTRKRVADGGDNNSTSNTAGAGTAATGAAAAAVSAPSNRSHVAEPASASTASATPQKRHHEAVSKVLVRAETSDLSPYILDQRLTASTHASMSRHNTARELKFAAKCLLLDLAASASESESGASDHDDRTTSSRLRMRQINPRTRTATLLGAPRESVIAPHDQHGERGGAPAHGMPTTHLGGALTPTSRRVARAFGSASAELAAGIDGLDIDAVGARGGGGGGLSLIHI